MKGNPRSYPKFPLTEVIPIEETRHARFVHGSNLQGDRDVGYDTRNRNFVWSWCSVRIGAMLLESIGRFTTHSVIKGT